MKQFSDEALAELQAARLARQHPRAGERHRARGDPVQRRDHPARAPDAGRRGKEKREARRATLLPPMLSRPPSPDDIPVNAPLRDVEMMHIRRVLEHKNWNQSAAAQALGIDRKTLRNKIREFKLEKP